MSICHIPGRTFLDSSTLQTLQRYGDFLYDGGTIATNDKLWAIPDGIDNVYALSRIIHVARRGSLQFVLSRNSLQEVLDRGRYDYLQWAFEMLEYWQGCLDAYSENNSAFSGQGLTLYKKFSKNRFGYLSKKDASLIRDAVLLECDIFLTMERKLPKNSQHIERELGIKVVQPIGYWDMLKPWAAMLA